MMLVTLDPYQIAFWLVDEHGAGGAADGHN